MQTTLQALFRSTVTGVVVQGFRSSSVPATHEGYLVESRRPLWFRFSQANHSVFNTLSHIRLDTRPDFHVVVFCSQLLRLHWLHIHCSHTLYSLYIKLHVLVTTPGYL